MESAFINFEKMLKEKGLSPEKMTAEELSMTACEHLKFFRDNFPEEFEQMRKLFNVSKTDTDMIEDSNISDLFVSVYLEFKRKESNKMSPIKFITITEFKAKATAIVAEVKRTGRQVVVTVKGQPTVVISPVKEEEFEIVKAKKK